MKKIILLIFIAAAIGGALYVRYFMISTSEQSLLSNERLSLDLIDADEQPPATRVVIKTAKLELPGFVVIRENDNGNFGNIIGNSRFMEPGEHINIGVSLIKMTVNGEYLYAVIHEDSGDKIFNPSLDLAAKDKDENIIYKVFRIDVGALEPKYNITNEISEDSASESSKVKY